MALRRLSKIGGQAAVMAFCLATGSFAEALSIASASAGVDERFAIASERYGDDQVVLRTQGNSRRDGTGGSTESVYVFNCLEQTYEKIFEGNDASESMQAGAQSTNGQKLNRDSEALPLAQQACKEHDLQILELKW